MTALQLNPKLTLLTEVYIRGVMVPALDPDPESDFQLLVIPDPDSDPVKSRIVTPIKVF